MHLKACKTRIDVFVVLTRPLSNVMIDRKFCSFIVLRLLWFATRSLETSGAVLCLIATMMIVNQFDDDECLQ